MKKIYFTQALYMCSVFIASCDLFSSKASSSNPLIGQWKIDSISYTDSNAIGVLLLAMNLPDSSKTKYHFLFTTDSVSMQLNDSIVKTSYQIDTANRSFFIKEDSSHFSYQSLDESSIKLMAKDSTILYLKKR